MFLKVQKKEEKLFFMVLSKVSQDYLLNLMKMPKNKELLDSLKVLERVLQELWSNPSLVLLMEHPKQLKVSKTLLYILKTKLMTQGSDIREFFILNALLSEIITHQIANYMELSVKLNMKKSMDLKILSLLTVIFQERIDSFWY